jgi:protocatechuate 4,5-dioxygenase alpha chain
MRAPPFDLDVPGTLPFGSQQAFDGHALNKFALSLRLPANRELFLDNERAYMGRYGVADDFQALISTRDWTALLRRGGHLQAMLKVAATVGMTLWHIGAHNASVSVEELKAACPRRVTGLPSSISCASLPPASLQRRSES